MIEYGSKSVARVADLRDSASQLPYFSYLLSTLHLPRIEPVPVRTFELRQSPSPLKNVVPDL